jgi:diguanylate cyclase (GGDEF)-like protein
VLQVESNAASQPRGVLTLVVLVTLGAAAAVGAAGTSLAREGLPFSTLAGLTVLLAAAAFTEAFPLPIQGIPIGQTSLAGVFVVGAAVLYGWAGATLVSVLMQLSVEVARRRAPSRIAYNSSVYALAAAAAGAAAAAAGRLRVDHALTETPAAAAAFYGVDLVLVALIVAVTGRERFGPMLRRTVMATSLPLAIMIPLAVALVALWDRSPFLILALLGPLVAFDLYQRAQLRVLESMRAAVTDPLTGLGNRRRFDERLDEEIPPTAGGPVSVCLLDVDSLKRINDEYGHPIGDLALAAVGARLASSGEAFRLGGDEFALLLPGVEPEQARLLVELVLVDLALEAGLDDRLRVSGGIAAYPRDGETPRALVDRADEALYHSKRHTPGSVHVRSATGPGLRALVADSPADHATRLQAAMSLARTVDSRTELRRSHSESVGRLAARIGARTGSDAAQCELLDLAGRLHDLGKVAIPDEILWKPGPLAPDERRVLERHPIVGSNMLTSLGLGDVSGWVRHQHERWDGAGFPDGLASEAIPQPARILAVADAFDTLISGAGRGGPLSQAQAFAELEQEAGTRFDPAVVEALASELRDPEYHF